MNRTTYAEHYDPNEPVWQVPIRLKDGDVLVVECGLADLEEWHAKIRAALQKVAVAKVRKMEKEGKL